jgi:filamentous hemagglutinin
LRKELQSFSQSLRADLTNAGCYSEGADCARDFAAITQLEDDLWVALSRGDSLEGLVTRFGAAAKLGLSALSVQAIANACGRSAGIACALYSSVGLAVESDQIVTSTRELIAGTPIVSMLEQSLIATGMSPQSASVMALFLGMSPAALEAFMVNRAFAKEAAAIRSAVDRNFGDRIQSLRAGLPSEERRGGNVADAIVAIDGSPLSRVSAHSKIDTPTAEQLAAGFVGVQQNRVFDTLFLPGANSLRSIPRAVDSEAKILEEVAARLGNNTSARGTMVIYSERNICTSCLGVMQQFQARYPNINITVYHNNGNLFRPPVRGR